MIKYKIQFRKKDFKCQLEKATMQKSGPTQCEEQKNIVNNQETSAGSAVPSNLGVLASEFSISVPEVTEPREVQDK